MILKLKPVFGSKSKSRLTGDGGFIRFKLNDDTIETRTQYEYVGENGVCLVNEQSMIAKNSITAIGCAYDDENDCFYILLQGPHTDANVNVETAEEANDIYNTLIKWWK